MNSVRVPDYAQEKERFDRLYAELRDYIGSACFSFGRKFYFLGADDLRQECAIKLLHIIRTNPGLSDADLSMVFKTSMYNLLKDIYRSYKRSVERFEPTDDMDAFESTIDQFESLLFKEYVRLIKARLGTELERQLLDLLLEPDKRMVEMAQEHQKEAERRKSTGEMVMKSGEVQLTDKLLAERLGVSRATASRYLQRVRQQLLDILFSR